MLPESFAQLHHAYLIQGSSLGIAAQLKTTARQENINLMLHEVDAPSFGVEDAAMVREKGRTKVGERERVVVLVCFNTMTHEAQNALLKILEEPSRGTHLFLITNRIDTLLPTIHSRVHIIQGSKDQISTIDSKTFLSAKKSERIKQIEAFLKKDALDHRHELLNILDAFEQYVAVEVTPPTKSLASAAIYEAKRFQSHLGMPVKMILENLALQLPIL